MVTITCGVNQLPTDRVVNLSIGDIRRKYRDQLNIPQGARAVLNGRQSGDDVQVKDGDELEFVKETGEKGLFKLAG
jgi:hypothetical protein